MTRDNSAGAANSGAHPAFDVQPYRPDGGFTGSGLMMLVGAMLIAGAIIGFAAHLVSQVFYLILLFPILIGLFLGAVGIRLVKFANLRNPLLGGVAGLVGGAAAMLMMHWFDYQSFRREMSARAPEVVEIAQLPAEQREAEIQQYEDSQSLRQYVTAVSGFPQFMDFQAQHGVEISFGRGGSNREGLNLGYAGSYIYWIIELFIVAGITFAIVRAQTTEPFCTDCSLWKPSRLLGVLGGPEESAIAGVSRGDIGALAAAAPGASPGELHVSIAECGNCRRARPDVKLERVTTNKEGKLEKKVLTHASWPVEAVADLEALFAAPEAPDAIATASAGTSSAPPPAPAPGEG